MHALPGGYLELGGSFELPPLPCGHLLRAAAAAGFGGLRGVPGRQVVQPGDDAVPSSFEGRPRIFYRFSKRKNVAPKKDTRMKLRRIFSVVTFECVDMSVVF